MKCELDKYTSYTEYIQATKACMYSVYFAASKAAKQII